MSPLLLALLALALCGVLFAACFRFARRIDNYGVVDVVWSYAFGPVAALYALLSTDGWLPRRILIAVVAVLWSARLGTYLCRRVASHHPEEDGRYREMRRRWSKNFTAEMFRFYQFQAASVVVLATPFLLAVGRPEARFTAVDWIALALFLVAQTGEAVADAQLASFKKKPANRGRVCDAGLWALSRHPNYFFVSLTWLGFALFALPATWGWLGLVAPAAILHLLLFVTGIPMTEEQALRTKGEAYRDYQRRVSAFVPWFPKAKRQSGETS